LLPALILHGGFDFFLFAVGVVQYAYDINSAAFEVISFLFPFLVTVLGIVVAKWEFDAVIRSYQSDWQSVQQEDHDVSVHNALSAAV
jgi:hypothetical protein